jgi:putative ABC transport system permease protein
MFTILAIGIACLGLVAMMSQKIIEKTKEIGIRKILGAKSLQIGKILIHATVVQLSIASIAAIPLTYYLKNQYLQKYSEQITISWWYYAIPIGILLFIMFLTISTMLWKAVRRNPVEALKYE